MGISAVSIIVGMVLRRAFMKIDLPKLDIYLEDSIFTTNWVRKFLAYVSALAVFFVYQSAIPETYLMDIAL